MKYNIDQLCNVFLSGGLTYEERSTQLLKHGQSGPE